MEATTLEATREEVGKVVDMKDYYQTNKGRLLGIGGILILVGLFSILQEAKKRCSFYPSLVLFCSLPEFCISLENKHIASYGD